MRAEVIQGIKQQKEKKKKKRERMIAEEGRRNPSGKGNKAV